MKSLQEYFYLLDFAMALFVIIMVFFLYRRGIIDSFIIKLFWTGFFLGLSWELPITIVNNYGLVPVARFFTPVPVPFAVLVIAHSFWDAGLFLVGVWLVRLASRDPFERFSIVELLVLVTWGQAQELVVELASIAGKAWVYVPHWWNPALFYYRGEPVTLMPQLIWLVAPVIFYLLALKIRGRMPREKISP